MKTFYTRTRIRRYDPQVSHPKKVILIWARQHSFYITHSLQIIWPILVLQLSINRNHLTRLDLINAWKTTSVYSGFFRFSLCVNLLLSRAQRVSLSFSEIVSNRKWVWDHPQSAFRLSIECAHVRQNGASISACQYN